MAAPTIGDQGREIVRRMAARRWGVTLQEICEELDVTYWSARRFVARLMKDGVLKRSGERRRRTEIFEKVHGAGAFVYRARRTSMPEHAEWHHARSWKRRGRRRKRNG